MRTAVSDWWRRGVVYQIYPRSFQDSNGDGIGDLRGIGSRLDYLNDGTLRSLGVDAIWLSPFYPSPMADFGYDVANYCDVDPTFGTLADFDELIRGCHARGIRVIVDFVPNHTSDRHPWFVDSRSGRESPKRDWYVWADPKPDGSPPTNWLAAFQDASGRRPAWTMDRPTGQYYLHTFLPQQPDLNWWSTQVRHAMDDVLGFWLDRGVDGFRVDAAAAIGHDPELRDNPSEETLYSADLPVALEIVRHFRRTIDEYDDRMAVGEVYLFEIERLVRYFGQARDAFHLVFNFAFLNQPWAASGFRRSVQEVESVFPRDAWPAYTLSNHDHSRTASRYDDEGPGDLRARVAGMMLLTLRGTPFLYYGEELGMRDAPIPSDRIVDVAGRDPERTPMQWETGSGTGFTTGRPWLPIGPDADAVNVAVQDGDPGSTLALYRRLIWYRKESSALQRGTFHPLQAAEDVFSYIRRCRDERLFVALNFSDRPMSLDLQGVPEEGQLQISTDPNRQEGPLRMTKLVLAEDEGIVVSL